MPLQQFKDKQGKYRWRIRASNGKIILTGEDYKTKSNADRAEEDIITALIESLAQKGYKIVPTVGTI